MYKDLFERPLIFENVYDSGTSLWFTEYEYNALMKMDKKSHRVEWKGSFPGEPFLREHLYMATVECGGKLYFAPYWAREIAEYDLKTETIRKIPLCMPRKESAVHYENGRFIRAVSFGKKVYFIPVYYPGILCYDTEQDQMYCLDDWVDKLEELRAGEYWYFTTFEVVGDKLILPSVCADVIVVVDVVEEKSQVFQIPHMDYLCRFGGICCVDDYCYLVSVDGTVSKRKVDSLDVEIKRWKSPVSGSKEVEFYPVRYADGLIYIFPNGDRCAYRIDSKTDERSPVLALKGEKEKLRYNFLSLSALWDNGRFYLSRGIARCLLVYEPENERKWEYQLFLSERDRELLREYKEKDLSERIEKEAVAENEADNLTDFLNLLKTTDRSQRENHAKRRTKNGRSIYQALCP